MENQELLTKIDELLKRLEVIEKFILEERDQRERNYKQSLVNRCTSGTGGW